MTYADGAAVTMFSPKHPHTEMSFKHISSPMMKHRHLQFLAEKIHPSAPDFFSPTASGENVKHNMFSIQGSLIFLRQKPPFCLFLSASSGLTSP